MDSNNTNVFKRCGCRNPVTGRRLDRSCPRLAEPAHGSWYFTCSAANVFGRAERVRRGGYGSQAAAVRARNAWLTASRAARTGRAWTVERWLRYWLSTRVSIRPTTRLSHEGYIEQFLIPQLGHIRLAELTTRHLAAAFSTIGTARNRSGQLHALDAAPHPDHSAGGVERGGSGKDSSPTTPPGQILQGLRSNGGRRLCR